MGIMDKRRQERCELTKEEREFIEKLYRTNLPYPSQHQILYPPVEVNLPLIVQAAVFFL